MQVIQDCIWLCSDCTQVAVNGVYGIDLLDERATLHGLAKLELKYFDGALVPDFDCENGDGERQFSDRVCESCGTSLIGYRAKFAILGE